MDDEKKVEDDRKTQEKGSAARDSADKKSADEADESSAQRTAAESSKTSAPDIDAPPEIESPKTAAEPSEPDPPPNPSPLSPPPVNAEENKSLVSYLALWGPLIIVGFLVLVFHGDQPPPEPAAIGASAAAPEQVPATVIAETAPLPIVDEAPTPVHRLPGAIEDGIAPAVPMPAPAPAFPGASSSPPVAMGNPSPTGYPPPPGPYRNPWGSGRYDPWMEGEARHFADRPFEEGSEIEPSMGEGE
ncbi:MAG: hypothetical protein ISN28_07080 [Ectothiorhodospiraceae bacterium AqS1]|nr:hypothetical protein [Ectothiorhodospiraceae bacterium AqS1]